ncbi:hypothetical protein F1529_17420 [Alcanivorax sp. VBW004]|uniref:DUF3653 domain-containing protein n=1 Tax=Alcanivorax sp. VBW004 TaxID=1287708 RepID=UPI0012BBCEC4|nr:hypothetical protein [Alcanivorax sp. VBW004]
MTFREVAFGLSIDQIQQITQLHPTTLRRYLRTNSAPSHIIRLVAFFSRGELPSNSPKWNGWKVREDALSDPDGNEYRPDEIRSIWALRQLQAELERIKKQPAQLVMPF